MEKLTGLDTGFYYFDSPGMHLHIGVLLLFDAGAVAPGDRMASAQKRILERIDAMEHFRDRIVEVPLGLAEPYWVADPDFDIANHVKEHPDHGVLTREELTEVAAAFISEPIDKSRPLWELLVVPEIEGGKFAVVSKLHHTLIDGVAGIEVLASLFDLEPNPKEFWGSLKHAPTHTPVDFDAVVRAMGNSILSKVLRAPKDAMRVMEFVADWLSFNAADDNSKLLRPLFTAPRTPVNGTLSKGRSIAWAALPLVRVKEIAHSANATVNDVVLTMVSLALDDYLGAKGFQGGADLVAMMPMSNPRRDAVSGSNQISSLFISLANSCSEPSERLAAVTRATGAAKKFHRSTKLEELVQLSSYVPPLLTWALSQAVHQSRAFDFLPPAFNVLVSTVRGTDFPLYFAGSQLLELIPFAPLAESSGLNLTALSYDGSLIFGAVGDAVLAGDVQVFVDAVVASLVSLAASLVQNA